MPKPDALSPTISSETSSLQVRPHFRTIPDRKRKPSGVWVFTAAAEGGCPAINARTIRVREGQQSIATKTPNDAQLTIFFAFGDIDITANLAFLGLRCD